MKIVETGATHYTNNNRTRTWIDHIWVDENDVILGEPGNQPLDDRVRHRVIDVTINVHVHSVERKSFTYRNYKNISPSDLNERLSRLDWAAVDNADADLEGALNCLNNNLQTAIDELAPLKTVTIGNRDAPWIGSELKLLIKRRNYIDRKYRKIRSAVLLDELLRLSNEVEIRMENDRSTFIQQHLSDAIDEKRDIWKVMRDLNLLPKRKEEDLNGFSPGDLNEYFSGISVSPDENIDDALDIILSSPEEGFSFRPVNSNDVVRAIDHFSTQAQGTDGIPQRVVKKGLPSITNFLVKIFNSSFAQSKFPEAWKRAQVIALRKKVAPESPSDFRPISLLCFFSKVLEKLAHDQIAKYFSINNVLDPLQTGYRKNNSTHTALLKLTDDVRIKMDKGKLTFLLLFDFSKAFDTVSPSKLLSKLRTLGFSRAALLWIKSYLQGRRQQVTTRSNGSSDWLETNLGVPQGSVLGPLLFTLYVNDLRDVLNLPGDGLNVSHIFYADDLQIYLHFKKEDYLLGLARLAEAARRVAAWAVGSGLHLNAGKTKAIMFGTQDNVKALNRIGLPGIDMGDGVLVPFSDEVVSLGVTLDSKMTWKPHVRQVAKKVNRALYSLRFFRECTGNNVALRKRLVEALVQPYLDYCSVVVLDAAWDGARAVLQRLSNSCVRYVYGVRRDSHVTPFRRQLGWLSVDMRRYYHSAILMFKILSLGKPSYLAEFFTRYQPRANTRGAASGETELEERHVTLDRGKRAFHVRCARFWNLLPLSLRHEPTRKISAFKKAVREYLFNCEGENFGISEGRDDDDATRARSGTEMKRRKDIMDLLEVRVR